MYSIGKLQFHLKHLHLHLLLFLFWLKPCSIGEMGCKSPVPVRGCWTNYQIWFLLQRTTLHSQGGIPSLSPPSQGTDTKRNLIHVFLQRKSLPQQIGRVNTKWPACSTGAATATQYVRTTCSRYMKLAISLCTKELCNVLTFTYRCWQQCLCNSERKKVKNTQWKVITSQSQAGNLNTSSWTAISEGTQKNSRQLSQPSMSHTMRHFSFLKI